MAYTLQTALRELGTRKYDLVIATADTPVDTTHLQAADISQEIVVDTPQLNCWVYGVALGASQATPVGNQGVERRGLSWNATTQQLTLAAPGFPSAPSGGQYELHFKHRRSVKMKAINACLRMLDLYWYRPVRDETLTTAINTWRFTLPAGVNWGNVFKVMLSVSADSALIGYPFMDATPWSPHIEREVSTAGVETFLLRFGAQPPPNRTIRILAEVGYEEVALETDVLPLDGSWGNRAYEYIQLRSSFLLDDWAIDRAHSGDVQKYAAIASGRLQRMYAELRESQQSHENILISVPGVRDGMHPGLPRDLRYLAALHTPGSS